MFAQYSLGLTMVVACISCAPGDSGADVLIEGDVELMLEHDSLSPESEELPGQTWQAGSVTFSFQRGNHVLVRGGDITESMPTGAPGRYSLDETKLALEVLGRSYAGSWDGDVLMLNGHHATYLGRTETIYPDSVLDKSQPAEEELPDVEENP